MLGGCPVCPESWAVEGGAAWVRGEEHGWRLGKGCSQGAFWVTFKVTTMELELHGNSLGCLNRMKLICFIPMKVSLTDASTVV